MRAGDTDDTGKASSVKSQLNKLSKAGTLKGSIAIAAGSGISGSSRRRMQECADATEGGMLIETSDSAIGEAFGKASAQIEAGGYSETL